MKIIANGNEAVIPDGSTITAMLKALNVEMPDMVSVEVNGEILTRAVYDTTPVKPGDRVEFLYFMGGGAAAGRRTA